MRISTDDAVEHTLSAWEGCGCLHHAHQHGRGREAKIAFVFVRPAEREVSIDQHHAGGASSCQEVQGPELAHDALVGSRTTGVDDHAVVPTNVLLSELHIRFTIAEGTEGGDRDVHWGVVVVTGIAPRFDSLSDLARVVFRARKGNEGETTVLIERGLDLVGHGSSFQGLFSETELQSYTKISSMSRSIGLIQ